MSKVFYITVDTDHADVPDGVVITSDFYFVRGDDPEECKEHLREQIRKYYFKALLANKPESSENPRRLGDRIIVQGWVTDTTADLPLHAEDATAAAYILAAEGKEYWSDWVISQGDTESSRFRDLFLKYTSRDSENV